MWADMHFLLVMLAELTGYRLAAMHVLEVDDPPAVTPSRHRISWPSLKRSWSGGFRVEGF